MTDPVSDEISELYMLGLPIELIARQYGVTASAVSWRARKSGVHRLTGPRRIEALRRLRHDRILAAIAAYPSKSMFRWPDSRERQSA